MAIPAVTCGDDQFLEFSSAGTRNINLTATATNPTITAWAWLLLAIPEGSVANVGVKGDFTDGVATIQNPTLQIDNAIDGTYVVQCIATNSEGPSNPATDKENGQQLIIVRTATARLELPNDYAYDWGKILIPTLRKIGDSIGPRTQAPYGLPVKTIYVDPTGSDDNEGEDWAHAMQSIEAAWFKGIPGIVSRRYIIMFRETVVPNGVDGGWMGGKIITEAGKIIIRGESNWTTLGSPEVATGWTAVSVTKTGAGWTVNEHRGKMVWLDFGGGVAKVRGVIANTADTIYLNLDMWASPSGVAFTFVKPNSVFDGWMGFECLTQDSAALILTNFCSTDGIEFYNTDARLTNIICDGWIYVEGRQTGIRLRWNDFDSNGNDIWDGLIGGGVLLPASATDGSIDIRDSCEVMIDGFLCRQLALRNSKIQMIGGSASRSMISNCAGVGMKINQRSFVHRNNVICNLTVDGGVEYGIQIKDSSVRLGSGVVSKNTSTASSNGHGVFCNNGNLVIVPTNDEGTIGTPLAGTGNAGYGAYERNGSKIRPRSGYPPTITGTLGDVANHAGVASWNDIEADSSLIDIGEMQYVKKDDTTEID